MAKNLGKYAKANAEALLRAEAMQLISLVQIERDFSVEDDSFQFENATYDEFIAAWDEAREQNREEEFYAKAAEHLLPVMQQIMAQMGTQQGQGQ